MANRKVGCAMTFVLLAACAAPESDGGSAGGSIEGVWEARALAGAQGHPRFELAGGKLTGHSGCNGMSGRYLPGADGSLRFADVISTKMFCEGAAGASERVVLDALAKTAHGVLEAETLVLQDARRAPLLALTRSR